MFAILVCAVAFAPSNGSTQTLLRDSAGIRIVENPALADAPVRFRLASQPSLDLGGLDADPDLEFDAKRGVLRAVPLPSGAIAVLDVTRVQYFSAAGVRQRVVGREGGGPREFRELFSGCGLRGDTLVLFDGVLARIVTLSATGEFVQTAQRDDARATLLYPCFDDGSVLVRRTLSRQAGRVDFAFARTRRSGTELNTIAIERGVPDRDMITKGQHSLVAFGNSVYSGDGRTGEVRVYRHEGGLSRIIRTRERLVPLTAGEIDEELLRTYPEGRMESGVRENLLRRARSQLVRTTWPVYAQFMPGDDGRLWVQEYRRFSSRAASPFAREAWTAFDSAGRIEGRLLLPAPVRRDRPPPRVLAFVRGGVLLLRFDDDGSPHLSLYSLERLGS